jgi:hypothetical protein
VVETWELSGTLIVNCSDKKNNEKRFCGGMVYHILTVESSGKYTLTDKRIKTKLFS